MSKTTDPDAPAKLPEPRLPAPKLLGKKDAPAAAEDDAEPEAAAPEPPPPDSDEGGERVRSDTFLQRKADARNVGIDTAFMDGLTADLVLDGVPEHLVPEGAGDRDEPSPQPDAVDADALFDAPPVSETSGASRASGSVLAASSGELAVEPSVTREASDGDAAAPRAAAAAAPRAASATPAASAARGSETSINPATLAIGGAILAIVLLLVFKTCSGSGGDEASDRTAAAGRAGAGANAAAEAGAAEAGAAEGGAAEGGAGGGAAAGGAGVGEGGDAAGGGGAAAEGASAAEAGGDDAAEGGAAEAGADEAAEAAEDGADEAAAADETAGDAAAAEGGSEAGDVAIVDETEGGAAADKAADGDGGDGRSGGKSSTLPGTSSEPDPDRAAEAAMSAEELLAAAKESLKRKRYRDAYRQSTASYHKKATNDALKVRVQSACGLDNKSAAKSSFDKVEGMSDRRDLRAKCREHGVRLGV